MPLTVPPIERVRGTRSGRPASVIKEDPTNQIIETLELLDGMPTSDDLTAVTDAVNGFGSSLSSAQSDITTLESKTPTVSPAANEFAAHIDGQQVWIKLPRIDPTASAYGLSHSASDTDNVTALANAASVAESEGLPLVLPEAEIPYREGTIPPNVIIEGKGSDRTILTRAAGTAHTPMMTIAGSLGTPIALNDDAAQYDMSVETLTDPGMAAGDYVKLESQRLPWGGSNRPDHDVMVVSAVSGSGPYTITLEEPLTRNYAVADSATIAKMTPASPRIYGVGFGIDPAVNAVGLLIQYATDASEIDDILIRHWSQTAVTLQSCARMSVSRVSLADPTALGGGEGYGLLLRDGTRHVHVDRVYGRNTRHTVLISYGSSHNHVTWCEGSGAVGPDFDTHGMECYHNLFAYCTSQGASNAFSAGNASFGADFFTTFDHCTAIGNTGGSGTTAHFVARQGSENINFDYCTSIKGYAGMTQSASKDGRVTGAKIYDPSTTGVAFNGGCVRGHLTDSLIVRSGGRSIQGAGGSDYLIVDGVETIDCALTISLGSAENNTTRNLIER